MVRFDLQNALPCAVKDSDGCGVGFNDGNDDDDGLI